MAAEDLSPNRSIDLPSTLSLAPAQSPMRQDTQDLVDALESKSILKTFDLTLSQSKKESLGSSPLSRGSPPVVLNKTQLSLQNMTLKEIQESRSVSSPENLKKNSLSDSLSHPVSKLPLWIPSSSKNRSHKLICVCRISNNQVRNLGPCFGLSFHGKVKMGAALNHSISVF